MPPTLGRGVELSLAGLAIWGDDRLFAPFSFWPAHYRPFLSTGSARPVDARFVLGSPARRPAEAGFVASFSTSAVQFGTVGPRRVYRFRVSGSPAYLMAEAAEHHGQIEMWPDGDGSGGLPPWSQPVDRVLCIGVLAHRRAVIVHSCGWIGHGRALLFPGVSGAGKTTLCRQLLASGQGQVISDDRVVVRHSPEGFRAWGTPWPGDARQALNASAPLAAMCFIEKTPEHRLRPIRPTDAFRRLLQTAGVPWYSPALRDRVLPVLEELVAAVPAFSLGFRPSRDVVDCLLPLVGGSVP